MISDGIQGYRMLFLHTALTLDTQCSDQEKVEPPEPDSCDEEAEVTTWDWIGLSLAIQFEIPISIGFPKGVSHFCLEYPWIFLSLWVEYQEDLGPESTDKTRRLSGTGTIPFPTGTPNLCFGLGRQFNQWCMIYIYDIYIWYIYDIYIYDIYMIYIYMIYIYIYIWYRCVGKWGTLPAIFFWKGFAKPLKRGTWFSDKAIFFRTGFILAIKKTTVDGFLGGLTGLWGMILGKLQRPHCSPSLESWLVRRIIPKWPNYSG